MHFHSILEIFLRYIDLDYVVKKALSRDCWPVCLDIFLFGVRNAAIDFLISFLKHCCLLFCLLLFFFPQKCWVAFMLFRRSPQMLHLNSSNLVLNLFSGQVLIL